MKKIIYCQDPDSNPDPIPTKPPLGD